ncbi:TOPRIM nucleotidyl transferase/hydrolase domain-containing protein [Serratia sp. PAMC26656]|uniref:TOPRIM nucleotidyl transferase/hydrolase domain-containing protein n=1 Tax=Serratia sp. PAMC26656 TaxID=2775909 RepID=UPI001F2FC251|nr:TOPRIM nucleotidyl transferase/hydrolase domain-containing protein [Serratia sp. PAMC26656]
MGTTIEDIRYEEMLSELQFESVMKSEARKQCIYIFVEGESEEITFQPLLESFGVDFEKEGIIIANYNGIGNLRHAIRILGKTLSHDRPIIVTFDDDLEGKKVTGLINDPLITYFKIPYSPVVTYKDGSKGGSFEECFTPDCFIDSCFKPKAIDSNILTKSSDFKKIFNPKKPWISQLAKFILDNGGKPGSIKKVEIAGNMASAASPVPQTFSELAKVITDIRAKNPIKHPDNVELKI